MSNQLENQLIDPQSKPDLATKVEFAITTTRATLFKALSHLQSIVERRNIVPILSNVKLDATADGLLLTATDMDISASEVIKAEVKDSGSITVPVHTLYDIIRKLPEEDDIEIAISQKENGKININAGSCKFSLSYLTSETFPTMDYGQLPHKFLLSAKEIITIIDKNKFSISTEETRYNLNGIFLHVTNGENTKVLRAVATDGHRLSRVEIAMPQGAENILGIILPRKTVMEIRKLVDGYDGDVSIELSDSKIKFSFGNIQLISKLIDGNFPDYEHLIPVDNKLVMKIATNIFTKAVDRVSIITFEKLRAIKLSLKTNLLTIFASGEANGSGSEELTIEYSDKELELGFNSKYLLEILSAIKGETLEFHLADDVYAPALIKDPSDQSVLFVLMPMLV